MIYVRTTLKHIPLCNDNECPYFRRDNCDETDIWCSQVGRTIIRVSESDKPNWCPIVQFDTNTEKSIYFLIGKPASGKDYLLNLITGQVFADQINSRLFIIHDFVEDGMFALSNEITRILRKENVMADTSFIVVMNKKPKYKYVSLREKGYTIKTLNLEEHTE